MVADIRVVEGDITALGVDAIVNAANTSLLGGGGVDGAIHRAAGPELRQACAAFGGCPTGEARITPGFRLPSRWVVHTPGPIWRGGQAGEDRLLASCYRNSLDLAVERGAASIAFPSISTGAFGFPLDRAAAIAVRELRAGAERHPTVTDLMLVAFSARTRQALEEALETPAR